MPTIAQACIFGLIVGLAVGITLTVFSYEWRRSQELRRDQWPRVPDPEPFAERGSLIAVDPDEVLAEIVEHERHLSWRAP